MSRSVNFTKRQHRIFIEKHWRRNCPLYNKTASCVRFRLQVAHDWYIELISQKCMANISLKTLRSTAAVALGALGLLGALGHAFCGTALPSIQELPDMEGCITMGTRQDLSVDFGFSTFLSLELARKTATVESSRQVKDVDGWPAKQGHVTLQHWAALWHFVFLIVFDFPRCYAWQLSSGSKQVRCGCHLSTTWKISLSAE